MKENEGITLIGYKITDGEMRGYDGFQYEVGKEYECAGEIELRENGFHAYISPRDLFENPMSYEHPRYFKVVQWGEMKMSSENEECLRERASSHIKIVSELTLEDIFRAVAETLKRNEKPIELKGRYNTSGMHESGLLTGDTINEINILDNWCEMLVEGNRKPIGVYAAGTVLISNGSFNRIWVKEPDNRIEVGGYNSNCEVCDIYNLVLNTGYLNTIGVYGDDNVIISNGSEGKIFVYGRNNEITINGNNNKIYCGPDSNNNIITVKEDCILIRNDVNGRSKKKNAKKGERYVYKRGIFSGYFKRIRGKMM